MAATQTSMIRPSLMVLFFSDGNFCFSRTDLDQKFKEMNEARENLTKYFGDLDKSNINKLNETATAAQAALFANNCTLLKKQVADNNTQIAAYQAQLQKLETPESAGDLQNTFAITAGIPPAPADAPAPDPKAPKETDYWTSISVEVSSSYSAEQSDSSSNSFSVGGGASWGLWSAGGSVSHSDATANAAKQMANLSIKASFDCMRVDITRSWLRGELFYDDDLRVATGNL